MFSCLFHFSPLRHLPPSKNIMVRRTQTLDTGNTSDDSISLNSTVLSDLQDEYAIDGGILAERTVLGRVEYLVKWEGYDEHCNTWEPADNFRSSHTLKEWLEKKMRVTRGLDQPFDMDAFDKRKQAIVNSIAARKERRRQKRKQRGIRVESSSTSSDAPSSDSDLPLVPPNPHSGKPATMDSDRKESKLKASPTKSSTMVDPKAWTDQERRALEAGITKVEGPRWNAILASYGSNGTINQDLRRMDKRDLKKMAVHMRREFEKGGWDVPSWLARAFDPIAKRSSTDQTALDPEASVDVRGVGGAPREVTPHKKPPSVSEHPLVSASQGRSRPTYAKMARIEDVGATIPRLAQDSSNSVVLSILQRSSTYTGTQMDTSEGTKASNADKKTATQGPAVSSQRTPVTANVAKTTTIERGHLSTSGAHPAPLEPQPVRTTGHNKKSEMKTLNDQNAAENTVKTSEGPKIFTSLATLNRISKKGRDEPAPNIDALTFINPRTRKCPKVLPPISTIESSDKMNERERPRKQQATQSHDNVQREKPASTVELKNAEGADETLPKVTLVKEDEQAATTAFRTMRIMRETSNSSKLDLFNRKAPDFILHCQFKIGVQQPCLNKVRLHVGNRDLKQLLLTVLSPSRDPILDFEKRCLAAEYHDYFSLVSTQSMCVKDNDNTDI